MSLLYIDGWDVDTAVAPPDRWTGGGTQTSIVGGGRTGNRLSLANLSLARSVQHAFAATDVVIVGIAILRESNLNAAVMVALTESGTTHVDLRMTATGQVTLTRNGTVLGTSTFVAAAGVWAYYEIKVLISDTVGTVELRVNGSSTPDISLTGLDTRNGGTGVVNSITLSDPGGSGTSFDDLYICDDAGSAPNNDFLGDVKVETLRPSGNGNSSQLVGSDGNSTDNYLLVDETTPDSDTTYVESATVGDKDTYAYGDLATTTGTVYGVQLSPSVRKTDAGLRSVCSVARLSGTETDSADKVLSTTYQHMTDMRETKPGGGAWTISDVNSAEFGIKVTA